MKSCPVISLFLLRMELRFHNFLICFFLLLIYVFAVFLRGGGGGSANSSDRLPDQTEEDSRAS